MTTSIRFFALYFSSRPTTVKNTWRAGLAMAKYLIDVVIYRGSDALYGWVFDSLQALGLKLGTMALCALPVAAGWLILSAALGQTQERRAERLAMERGV